MASSSKLPTKFANDSCQTEQKQSVHTKRESSHLILFKLKGDPYIDLIGGLGPLKSEYCRA